MKDLQLKPYKPRLLQALNKDDPDRRLEFCEWLVKDTDQDSSLLDRILWTDEAVFQTNGRVNRHNCVYWSNTNPHLIIEEELHVPRVVVSAGISSRGIVGPHFFDGNATAANYLFMLEDEVLPALQTRSDLSRLIWQQDGASPHYGKNVRDFLDATFCIWIGRHGTIEWPPRSPDLTPCDFSMWAIINDGVHS